jgi:hypothetical protein
VFSAGTAKPIPAYIVSQGKRAGGKVEGRYFAAPSVEQKAPASSLEWRGLEDVTGDVMLRCITAN